MREIHSWFIIWGTLFIALVLTLLPMPHWAVWCRPAWVLMVVIYWTMSLPYKFSVGIAWVMGLLLDLLGGTLLGEHALAFTIVVYLVAKMNTQLCMYPFLQQGAAVFTFILFYQFIIYCLQGFIGELPHSYVYWLSSFTSMLLWPWLFILLRDCQRRFVVS